VERLVDHAGSIALAARFTASGRTRLEGLILVMPEPTRITRLQAHLERRGSGR